MKTIVQSGRASRGLDALPSDVREAVEKALVEYAVHRRGDIKKLKGSEDNYRLRVGRYRVIFTESATTIHAAYIGKRDSQTY
jgi:mRNA interferase RelE/StbE